MKKKTICLITNWYPTKDNPYRGVFFKEQAFAVSDRFDFLVLHYREHFRKKPGPGCVVSKINEEKNTVEYDVDVAMPLSLLVSDWLHSYRVKRDASLRVDGIGLYASPRRREYLRRQIVRVFERHFRDAFDVLYCVDAQQEAFRLQCLAEAFGKPYVVGEHAPVPWPGTQITDFNKYAIEKANLFLAISEDKIRQLLLQNIRLPGTVYIGNMVDEQGFPLKPAARAQARTFIIVAANSFYKNYGMFIQVMNRLKQIAQRPFRVMVVGYAANKGYSRNVEALENDIRQSAFSQEAELIPAVPHEALGTVLSRADAFVMTSIQEGQPVSAMEAACCGLPIFSTRCGGVEDYVDEHMGRIYALTDVEGMANGLNDFLEGRTTFDSAYIRSAVIARFGREAFARRFTEAFEGVLGNA